MDADNQVMRSSLNQDSSSSNFGLVKNCTRSDYSYYISCYSLKKVS